MLGVYRGDWNAKQEIKGFRRVRQRTRERPSKRKQWSENQMLAALDAVIKDGLSGNKAAFYIIYHLLH